MPNVRRNSGLIEDTVLTVWSPRPLGEIAGSEMISQMAARGWELIDASADDDSEYEQDGFNLTFHFRRTGY